MIIQCNAFKVSLELEKIINNKGLWLIHGRPDVDHAIYKAQRMLDLIRSSLNAYNLQHTVCFLDPDDLAFIRKYEPC